MTSIRVTGHPSGVPRVACRPRRVKREEECVTEMLTGGQIEVSDSPWSSPVVLVTKKDGGTRVLCRLSPTERCDHQGWLILFRE